MGISLEQYRACIGSFNCTKTKQTSVFDDLDYADLAGLSPPSQPHPVLKLKWKASSLALLLIIISSLCHARLLVIGGVEEEPGPDNTTADSAILDALAEICQAAPNNKIRDCLREYDPKLSAAQLHKKFNKLDKDTLVETLEYLNVPNQSEYTKDAVRLNLIIRIENLLPEECNICKEMYCIKLSDTELLKCAMCNQSAHAKCLSAKFGIEESLLLDLGPDEIKKYINPHGLPGIHYFCSSCEESNIPSEENGKLKRKRANQALNSDEQSGAQIPGTPNPNHPSGNAGEPPAATHPVPPPVRPTGPAPAHPLNGDPDPTHSDPDSLQANQPTSTQSANQQLPRSLCPFYKRGICRYGISGRGCNKDHPKACPKLIFHGTSGPRGCNKGNNCEMFHPRMCHQSLQSRECLTMDCPLRHVRGTQRTTSNQRYNNQGFNRPSSQNNPGNTTSSSWQSSSNMNNQTNWHSPQNNAGNSSNMNYQNYNAQNYQQQANQQNFLDMMQSMRREVMTAMETQMAQVTAQLSQQLKFIQQQQQQLTMQTHHINNPLPPHQQHPVIQTPQQQQVTQTPQYWAQNHAQYQQPMQQNQS